MNERVQSKYVFNYQNIIFECQILYKIGFYAKKQKQYWTAPSIRCDDIAETWNEMLEKLIKFKIKLTLQPFIKTFCFVGEIWETLRTPFFKIKIYPEHRKIENIFFTWIEDAGLG